jgi:enoyl-CoA hydratase/carnithine racemase
MAEIAADKSVRCVVLTGAGKAFSAGGDLDFLQQRMHSDPASNSAEMRRFYARFLTVRTLPTPVVAAINGPAIGAGMCLAAACDLRIASTAAWSTANLSPEPTSGQAPAAAATAAANKSRVGCPTSLSFTRQT